MAALSNNNLEISLDDKEVVLSRHVNIFVCRVNCAKLGHKLRCTSRPYLLGVSSQCGEGAFTQK